MTNDTPDKELTGEENWNPEEAPGQSSDAGGQEGPGPKGSGGYPFMPSDPDESTGSHEDEMCEPNDFPAAGGGVHGPGGLP
jgi:hypothetical protein